MSSIKNRTFPKHVVEIALQIVLEYPQWGGEHCEEFCNISEQPLDYDELVSCCNAVDEFCMEDSQADVYDRVIEKFVAAVETVTCEISVNMIHSAIRVGRKAGLTVTRKCNNGGVTWICEISGKAELVAKFVRRFEY